MMGRCRREPTPGEAVGDPLVRAVMKADRADGRELEAKLNAFGDKLRERGTQ